MKPLEPATIPQSEVDRTVADYHQHWIAGDKTMRQVFNAATPELALQMIRAKVQGIRDNEVVYKNDIYQCNVRHVQTDCGWMIHLSIKRIGRQTIHDWRDLQEIKNQIVGPECEAVELYPAESRRVDTANQYHLWCCPDANWRFPFGWNEGRIVTDKPLGKSVNRPVAG